MVNFGELTGGKFDEVVFQEVVYVIVVVDILWGEDRTFIRDIAGLRWLNVWNGREVAYPKIVGTLMKRPVANNLYV